MNDQLSPQDIISSGLCIGCGSCAAQPDATGARMIFDSYGQLKPQGSSDWLRRKSESFAQICPFSPAARNEDDLAAGLFPDAPNHHSAAGRFQTAYVGYAAAENFRSEGSSGGMVSWVAAELLRNKLVDGVAHVFAAREPQKEGRFFRYQISRTAEEIKNGAKSRYYPIELSEILKTIREAPGRYAIVGVPCFVKAIHLLRREDRLMRERIRFTLGLFCGHMKSARFVESFAWQLGVSVDEVARVEFRHKDPNRPANWYNARLTLRDGRVVHQDWWHLADGDWGAGYFMNSACNFCDDVVAETADVSFGDAWVEPYSSDGNGTNVVVVRSPVVENLIKTAINDGRLRLDAVDGDFIAQTQAAGIRQRREGLAYRLTWHRSGVQPRKRVAPDSQTPSAKRKLIYRMRNSISVWSHRVFLLARLFKQPDLYIRWAKSALTVYHGFAYSRGKLGVLVKNIFS